MTTGKDPKDPETSMPRNFRVKNQTWWDFTDIVGERSKSSWVAGFIESIVQAPQAWKDFRALATARGETLASALIKAIRLYRDAE